MLRSIVSVVATLLLAGLAVRAEAGIVATSAGNVSVVPAPTGTLNQGNATFESGPGSATRPTPTFFVWEEGNFFVPGSAPVGWSGVGLVSRPAQLGGFTVSGPVTSYYMRFDPFGTPGSPLTVTNASITFDHHIIGVFVLGTGQANSDASFGAAGLTIGDAVVGNQRGLEPNAAGTSDRFTISPNGRTLNIVFAQAGGVNVDSLRILINPEPGTWALFGLGVLGLGGLVRRRRRRRA